MALRRPWVRIPLGPLSFSEIDKESRNKLCNQSRSERLIKCFGRSSMSSVREPDKCGGTPACANGAQMQNRTRLPPKLIGKASPMKSL